MTRIWLQISDEERRRSLTNALRDEHFEILASAGEAAHGAIDAVLTDHPIQSRQSSTAPLMATAAIGCQGPADVLLPNDVTDRELKLVCSLLSEITHLRRESSARSLERKEMQQLAFSDSLTDVPNRRAWNQEAERQFDVVKSTGRPLALAIIDLDHFKSINDRYGHTIGDDVLQSSARAIAASVRASDFLARLGGDEFGLLLPDCAPTAVASIMERIRRAIAAHCTRPVGPKVSGSIGFAIRQDETKFSQLFDRADNALLKAKETGRDRAIAG